MVAAGNDFIVIDAASCRLQATSYKKFAKRMCDRKFGVGADGLLVIEKSKKADIRMRIFNADGSEAEMCGNGARCAAFSQSAWRMAHGGKIKIETKAGIIESTVAKNNIRIKLTDPRDIKLHIPIKINNKLLRVNFVNTGVPHTVIFVQGLAKINVSLLGRTIRYHPAFKPNGTNVNFVEILSNDFINVRTYERGVEDETLACGTGATASAIITFLALNTENSKLIRVKTKSGEILKVYLAKYGEPFSDVWLEGKTQVVYRGIYEF
ncbi:MAG: diaminopimelate epimerase [Candidatus Omnitrophica bacterium]|nr:diaminopimelate epimerase [Candidatus Omnitrophota bacterium]